MANTGVRLWTPLRSICHWYKKYNGRDSNFDERIQDDYVEIPSDYLDMTLDTLEFYNSNSSKRTVDFYIEHETVNRRNEIKPTITFKNDFCPFLGQIVDCLV